MPGPFDPPPPAADAMVSDRDRQYAMFMHLSGFLGYVVGPLAILVTLALWLGRKDDSDFIDDHGREAMNYNISMWIYIAIASLLVMVLIGCVILPALVAFDIIAVIMAAVAANAGRYFRYPMTIRIIS